MQDQKNSAFARFAVAALFSAVMALGFDVWWHGAIGRESLWIPPHLLLYASVTVAIAVGWVGWRRTRERIWKRLAFVLLLIPVAAPFDELWHRAFGVESLKSPLIIWSPPHLLLAGALIGSFVLLLPILRRDADQSASRLFSGLCFAGILNLCLFLTAPIQPTGPYALIGFWGAGVVACVLVGVLFAAERLLGGIGAATTVVALSLLVTAIGFGEEVRSQIVIKAHAHAPAWLTIFSLLAPAVFLDLSRRMPGSARGAVAGLLWGGMLFGFSRLFFPEPFVYPLSDAVIAATVSAVGGAVAAMASKKCG